MRVTVIWYTSLLVKAVSRLDYATRNLSVAAGSQLNDFGRQVGLQKPADGQPNRRLSRPAKPVDGQPTCRLKSGEHCSEPKSPPPAERALANKARTHSALHKKMCPSYE